MLAKSLFPSETMIETNSISRPEMSQEETLTSNRRVPLPDADNPDPHENATTVTRADLMESLHRRMGISRTEAAKYVEILLEEIFEAIVTRREDVKLSSFGAFLVHAKRERVGRNPKTGEEAKITARLVVSFKPSNVLRHRVNNGFTVGDAQSGDGETDWEDGADRED